MLQPHIYNLVLYGFMISAAVFFIVLFFIPAPYGRYDKKGWGPQVNSRVAWMLMESPTIWLFLLLFLLSPRPFSVGGIVFLIIWFVHYGQRVVMFPGSFALYMGR